ncbi:hypothetical protein [Peribacillus frigoritolerans]|uniref:hypothetical protein n=1 Tax=Peribacillus frigoritolerans TaxID=450367 RepID=UPI003305A743
MKVFTYQTTAERYKKFEPFMTDQGFKATHPSGMELPNSKESVQSSMIGLSRQYIGYATI